MTSGVKRRSLLAMVAGTAIAAPTITGAKPTLSFIGFGGEYENALQKTLFEPFERATGIKVVRGTGEPSIPIMAEQLHTGVVHTDLMTIPDRMLRLAVQEGLLQPLDFGIIKPGDIPKARVTEHSVAHAAFAMALTYSLRAFPSDPPRTWQDFWSIERYSGSRALFDGPTYTLEFALIADGVPKDELYPLDVERAFRSLDRIRRAVMVWWTAFSRPGDLFKYSNLTMSPWSRAVSLIVNYQMRLGLSYIGAALTFENWVVPTRAPNAGNAMKFIAWAIAPERQAAFANLMGWGPTSPKALPLVGKRMQTYLPTDPQNAAAAFEFDGGWWAANARSVGEQWFEWRLRGG